jgi:synaptic vesicle membrane protein VAT-1
VKALVLAKHGPPEQVLVVQDWLEPQVHDGEVLIEVRAAGLNFADVMARAGLYPDGPTPECVMGYEVAGVVKQVGAGVEGFEPGQRVAAATHFEGFAELALANAANVMPLPDEMSFEEGAALPVNYGTAFMMVAWLAAVREGETVLVHAAAGGVGIAATQLLRDRGATVIGTASASKHDAIRAQGVVQAGDRVLVHAAAGGVGMAAIQLCRIAGAEVIGTASAAKHAVLKDAGVAHAIDYRTQDFTQEVKRLTGGEGVDVVLDALGEFKASYQCLRPGGRLVMYGASKLLTGDRRNIVKAVSAVATMPRFNALKLMNENRSVMGLNLLKYWDARGSLEGLIGPLSDLVERGVAKPVVAGVFPFSQAAAAHRLIQERKNVGKVILVPDSVL